MLQTNHKNQWMSKALSEIISHADRKINKTENTKGGSFYKIRKLFTINSNLNNGNLSSSYKQCPEVFNFPIKYKLTFQRHSLLRLVSKLLMLINKLSFERLPLQYLAQLLSFGKFILAVNSAIYKN